MKPKPIKLNRAVLSVLVMLLVVFQHEALAEPQPGFAAVSPIASEQVNLEGLRSGLRQTDAIGFTTKLSLKRKLDSLIGDFGDYHKGQGDLTLTSLREEFAELLASTLSLLREDDPQLFNKLWDAQGHLWLTVSDPVRFHAAVSNKKKVQIVLRRQD